MSYTALVSSYVHPFILYVLFGIPASYLPALLLARLPMFRDTRSRAVLFSLPLIVPTAAYFFRGPLGLDRCAVYGHSLGQIESWLCLAGNILAVILTPLFFAALIFGAVRVFLSIYATRRFVKKYGFASEDDYPKLLSILIMLCRKAGITVPGIIVTGDVFARAFTIGHRSPVLVVSEGLLRGLDDDELETVIAHELGHISRRDSFFNRALLFLKDIMFFVPLVNRVFRDYSLEKEKASDDFAVRLTDKPMAFAQALIKVWKLSRHSVIDELLSYPCAAGDGSALENRVERLLNGEHRIFNNLAFALIAALVIVLSSVFILQWVC